MAKKIQHLEFYTDKTGWEPPRDRYPTNDDFILSYVSHIQSSRNKKEVKKDLAEFVKSIWEEGDGCPKGVRHIILQFDELFVIYSKYKREGRGGGFRSHKKRQTDVPPKEPTRKSRRLCKADDEADVSFDTTASEEQSSTIKARKQLTRLSIAGNVNRDQWMEDHGRKLFDVISTYRLNNISSCKTDEVSETFDRSEFYYDQLDPDKRKTYIHTLKVTNEYREQSKSIQKNEARKAARTLSAFGQETSHPPREDEDDVLCTSPFLINDCHFSIFCDGIQKFSLELNGDSEK